MHSVSSLYRTSESTVENAMLRTSASRMVNPNVPKLMQFPSALKYHLKLLIA